MKVRLSLALVGTECGDKEVRESHPPGRDSAGAELAAVEVEK